MGIYTVAIAEDDFEALGRLDLPMPLAVVRAEENEMPVAEGGRVLFDHELYPGVVCGKGLSQSGLGSLSGSGLFEHIVDEAACLPPPLIDLIAGLSESRAAIVSEDGGRWRNVMRT
jgi:hypothetical protein